MSTAPHGYTSRRQKLIDDAVLWTFGLLLAAAVAVLRVVRGRPRA